MRRVLSALAVMVGLGLAVTPASAGEWHHRDQHPVSVFPQPKDPWRSWGVRKELPKHVHPHVHRGAGHHVIIATPAPAPVWVPGQWWWDGYAWRWAPGHWAH
jgi:hypothetical protein